MNDHIEGMKARLLNLDYLRHEPPLRPKDRGSIDVRRRRRLEGRDWPAWAPTMVGKLRLDHLETCIRDVIRRRVAGDVVETGVWRGGAMIFARAALNERRSRGRKVWLCDSFEGLPPPDTERWPEDAGSKRHERKLFEVSRAEVEANFHRFGVPLDGAEFIEGYFDDVLPGPLAERDIAVLRLDGDMYGSTMTVLRSLYDRVPVGGWVIIDDFTANRDCPRACRNFWAERDIEPDLVEVDWTCRAWRKG